MYNNEYDRMWVIARNRFGNWLEESADQWNTSFLWRTRYRCHGEFYENGRTTEHVYVHSLWNDRRTRTARCSVTVFKSWTNIRTMSRKRTFWTNTSDRTKCVASSNECSPLLLVSLYSRFPMNRLSQPSWSIVCDMRKFSKPSLMSSIALMERIFDDRNRVFTEVRRPANECFWRKERERCSSLIHLFSHRLSDLLPTGHHSNGTSPWIHSFSSVVSNASSRSLYCNEKCIWTDSATSWTHCDLHLESERELLVCQARLRPRISQVNRRTLLNTSVTL